MKKFVVFIYISVFLCFHANAHCDPLKKFPTPETVSEEAKALIDAPLNPVWLETPQTLEDWQKLQKNLSVKAETIIPQLIQRFNLSVKKEKMGSTPVFLIVPPKILPENKERVLLYIHGGGYVFNAGESGLQEALLMAHYCGITVISADYRVAPQHPFPAALDDVLEVYRELLKKYPPDKIGIFGTSTGGGLTLALVLAARQNGLPLPGAIAPGTPWSDLTKTGDSYFTNERVDNVLGLYDNLLKAAALAYAGKEDLKNPLLSPVYGDARNFPPAMFTTGTRDLFLSNTIRMHNKFLQADVPSHLLVLEGLSHAQYYFNPDAPETKFYFRELGKFFNKYLAK